MIEKYFDEIFTYDLLTYAAEAGLSEILANQLEILRDIWEIQYPGWVYDFIDKLSNSDSINRFVLFLKSPKNKHVPGNAKAYRRTIHEIPGLHRKILFILGDIFPTLTFMKSRYRCSNKLKALLYYPHRLGKLMWLVGK